MSKLTAIPNLIYEYGENVGSLNVANNEIKKLSPEINRVCFPSLLSHPHLNLYHQIFDFGVFIFRLTDESVDVSQSS